MSAANVTNLLARARAAFLEYEHASQEEVDAICARVAWACSAPNFVKEIADLTYKETGLGTLEAKVSKMGKIKGIYSDTIGAKTCGVVERDVEPGIIRFAKPVGVVAALIPLTNPELTPATKAIWTLKTRNAVILAPHPRAERINSVVAARIRWVLEKMGYPQDLVIPVEGSSVETSRALMEGADMVLATGGANMVRAAYSSGTPAYGVGAGNAYMIVDETIDVDESASMIAKSKTFDNASGCSADNGTLISSRIYDDMVRALRAQDGYLIKSGSREKSALAATLWSSPGVLNAKIVARPATVIAELAGISVPAETRFLMVEEDGIGPDHPFSREKLSPVLTLFSWDEFDQAVDMVNDITSYSGTGHSCGIHSHNEERILQLGARARVARVTVRQPHAFSNAGGWHNGLRHTSTLGCGTWGGGIASENVNFSHLLNITRVSLPVDAKPPTDEALFGRKVMETINEWERGESA